MAFHELSRSRPQGESFGPIPEPAFTAWFQNHDIFDLGQREHHLRVLMALDNVFVKHVNDKRKKQLDEMKSSSGRGSSVSRR